MDHLKIRLAAAIAVLSSGTGFVPYPAGPTFSASKAPLGSYTLAPRALLRDTLQIPRPTKIDAVPAAPGLGADLTDSTAFGPVWRGAALMARA